MPVHRAENVGSLLRPDTCSRRASDARAASSPTPPEPESEDELRARVEKASAYVPLGRLALSTQCGFASLAKGNDLSVVWG
jgi:hypothetical protein